LKTIEMHVLVISLLLASVQTQQNSCYCSCCVGPSCTPAPLAPLNVPSCTQYQCLAQCTAYYPQCQMPPNGNVLAQCGSTLPPQYNCGCYCCNTGSTSCSPLFVGYAVSHICQTESCSISCYQQYPNQCVFNQNGQTQGFCLGSTTTISTTTTIGPWLGYGCSCMCCGSGPSCPPVYVGTTSASQCSIQACTQACRNQYPSLCPLYPYMGQSSGTCTTQGGGNTRCRCSCCITNSCPTYEININGGCTLCDSACRQQGACISAYQVISQCLTNEAKPSIRFSLWLCIFLFLMIFSAIF
jgi:hypothetical protein